MTMTKRQYRAFLNLMMSADPWPASKDDYDEMDRYADRTAADRGYKGWIEAFHRFLIPCEICHGSGGGNNDPCSNCGGKGYLE